MIVYLATNMINDKVYVGKTKRTLKFRKGKHLSLAKSVAQENRKKYFHRALIKYGPENFEWRILTECTSLEEMAEKEKYYIAFYRAIEKQYGYNLTAGDVHERNPTTQEKCTKNRGDLSGANNPMFGKRHSDETKSQMSLAHSGKIPWNKGLRIGKSPMIGIKRSDETRAKISIACKGRAPWNKGRKQKDITSSP